MKYIFRIFMFIFLLPMVSCASNEFKTSCIASNVTWKDGDTISYTDTGNNVYNSLRIKAVDTPELHDQYHNFQTTDLSGKYIEYYFAIKATQFARSLTNNYDKLKIVISGRDKYNRNIGDIMIANQRYAKILLKYGWARTAYMDFMNEDMLDAEKCAIHHKAGIWSYVIDGKIPEDASSNFINESKKLNSISLRLGHVFNKIREIDKIKLLNMINK